MNSIQQATYRSENRTQANKTFTYHRIKLGVDVHADSYTVVRQLENATPQPPQRMSPNQFLAFALKQQRLAEEVWVCYEAGPTGFWLARKLQELNIQCLVVRPGRLDAHGRRVNNDKTDAAALAERLDRYVAGNRKALAVVRIPTEQEEMRRAHSRQRDQIQKEHQAMAAMGRSQLLLFGFKITGPWWKKAKWEQLKEQLPEGLIDLLEPLRQCVEYLSAQLDRLNARLESKQRKAVRPRGAGARTLEQLDSEVCDWNRFTNRKQPGSYSGLCGGVDASGESHADLPITKAGNRRVRTYLVEMAWRMVVWQPQSPLIQRWRQVLLNPRAHRRARKRAIVAVARRLFVDLWRWRTGQRTLEAMGYEPAPIR